MQDLENKLSDTHRELSSQQKKLADQTKLISDLQSQSLTYQKQVQSQGT
jgi:hypothetical protein